MAIHTLRALEAEVGMRLQHRAARAAEAYVEKARRLVAELDAGLRDAGDSPCGTVVVASHSVVTRFVLSDLLPAFHATSRAS